MYSFNVFFCFLLLENRDSISLKIKRNFVANSTTLSIIRIFLWKQIDFHFVLNQSEKCIYNPDLESISLCAAQETDKLTLYQLSIYNVSNIDYIYLLWTLFQLSVYFHTTYYYKLDEWWNLAVYIYPGIHILNICIIRHNIHIHIYIYQYSASDSKSSTKNEWAFCEEHFVEF